MNQPGMIRPWLLITFIIVLLGGGGYLGWYWYNQNQAKTATPAATSPTTTQPNKDYVEGQIIVGFKENISLEDETKLVESFGLKIKDKYSFINALLIQTPIGKEIEWINKFQQQSIVKYAELDSNRGSIEGQ